MDLQKPDRETLPGGPAGEYDAQRPRGLHWIFFGSGGLRAGWSILVFAMIWWVLTEVSGTLFVPYLHFHPDLPMSPITGLLMEIWQIGPVIVATAVMAAFEHRPLLSYGFQGQHRLIRFLAGLGWGFVAVSALVGVLWKLGFLTLEGTRLGARAALADAALWGAVFLLTGFYEESLFRGYLQYTLTRGLGFWWGALIFAVAFGAFHHGNAGESPVGLISAGAVGLIFCLSLWYTGSLWWAVGFHAAWDWGQSYFYGTADSGLTVRGHLLREHPQGPLLWSGGTTGPEGSLLILPLLAVVVAGMVIWWRREQSPFAGAGLRPKNMQIPAEVRIR